MGDHFLTLTPERLDIQPPEQDAMEKRVVEWMQKHGWVEKEKSDCTFKEGGGWRFTPSGAEHIADERGRGLSIYGFNVEKFDGKRGKGVFTNLEGGLEAAYCPACGGNVETQFYDMVGGWCAAEGFPPVKCPLCGAESGIQDYRCEPPWGFSQIGFQFWNIGEITPEFLEEFAAMLGEPVRVVWASL